MKAEEVTKSPRAVLSLRSVKKVVFGNRSCLSIHCLEM